MKYIYILIFSCFMSTIFAQNATVKGKVTDKITQESLIGANITYAEGKGTITDIDGNYSLSVPAGAQTILFRYVGYEDAKKTVNLTEGQVLVLDIQLSEGKELETVVVSAGKFEQKLEDLTVSMSVIKPGLLENKNVTNAETILDQVPGLTVQDGQVSIRGGSGFAYGAGSRVLMMVDELPLLSGDAGDVKWNTLPIENLSQIEVIKGASSVLFGSSALNGAINIRTAYPTGKPVTKISITHGIYDNPKRSEIIWWEENPYYTGINFMHSQQFGNLDLVVGGAGFSDQGYRQEEDEHRGRINFNIRYRSKKVEGLSYGVNVNAQKSKAGVFLIWSDSSDVYRPSYGFDPSNPETTVSVNYGWRVNIDPYLDYFTKKGNKHTLRTRLYWVKNENNTNQSANSYLTFGEYQFQKKFKNDFTLTSGIAGFYNTVKSELYGDHFGNNVGVFSQADKKIGKRLNISGGVRFEYYKLDSSETVSSFKIVRGGDTITFPIQPVFRAGANYKLFEHTNIRASFGQGYRYPSIAEKYVSTSVGALNIFPNANLKPERGWSSEIGIMQGIKIGKWKGYIDAAYFITQYQDMMEFAFGIYNPSNINLTFNPPSAPGYIFKWIGFRAENAESARISGLDFSIVGQGKCGPIDLSIFAGYTYMNPITLNNDPAYLASFSDSTTNMLKYRFRHLIKADIQIDYKRWSTGISVRYNSYMVNIDRSFENLEIRYGQGMIPLGDLLLPGLPGYRAAQPKGTTVFDYRLSYGINENVKIAAVINNLFNLEYMGRPGDVQSPRTFAMQFKIEF
jgi:outer membrane receptor protein involved in Fe transport